jgi:hypothetical protein
MGLDDEEFARQDAARAEAEWGSGSERRGEDDDFSDWPDRIFGGPPAVEVTARELRDRYDPVAVARLTELHCMEPAEDRNDG